jgi:hypothetical protein
MMYGQREAKREPLVEITQKMEMHGATPGVEVQPHDPQDSARHTISQVFHYVRAVAIAGCCDPQHLSRRLPTRALSPLPPLTHRLRRACSG